MKKHGLDSSPQGRVDYDARYDINAGAPGSAEQNDAIRRDVMRRFGS